MRETLERLWREYVWDQCAQIETEEERELTKKASKLHEAANTLLNTEQQAAVEKYVDAFFEMEALFLKKAFFKGCEFSTSFLLEVVGLKKSDTLR